MKSSIPKKVELLAPAGNFEKLETAIYYGADAVYLAGKDFSLRNYAENFSYDDMKKGIELAHKNNVNVYVACNIYSRNNEQDDIYRYLKELGNLKPDAIIIADPGILFLAREIIPDMELHLSTQSNTTNYNSVLFWEKQGIKRVNAARELSLTEIKEISGKCSIEIETFVHGAMCISVSGRCLLSSFLINRDSNRGLCAQSCRWQYSVVEEKRPGEYLPIREDSRGTYIFNSKDLCMIEYLPELIEAGISSLKIEGRMKGINYLASAVKVYREAIDTYYETPHSFRVKPEWLDELSRISNRKYCTGFYLNNPDQITANFSDDKPATIHLFIGKMLSMNTDGSMKVQARNKIVEGDEVEILTPKGPAQKDRIKKILKENGQPTSVAQPNEIVSLFFNTTYSPNDLIRKLEEISHNNQPKR
ncbi:MAG: U32 family peptidase [Proteobacteria bacterium]|nr:U32 family peptidase [Pseudomonadota bacterium]